MKKNGERYAEVHHLRHLAKGGTDLSVNLLTLCATCHRKAHYGNLSNDPVAVALGL